MQQTTIYGGMKDKKGSTKDEEEVSTDALFGIMYDIIQDEKYASDSYSTLTRSRILPERKLALCELIGESGCLSLSLVRIYEICDIAPRVPDHPSFVDCARQIKEKRQKASGKQKGTQRGLKLALNRFRKGGKRWEALGEGNWLWYGRR